MRTRDSSAASAERFHRLIAARPRGRSPEEVERFRALVLSLFDETAPRRQGEIVALVEAREGDLPRHHVTNAMATLAARGAIVKQGDGWVRTPSS